MGPKERLDVFRETERIGAAKREILSTSPTPLSGLKREEYERLSNESYRLNEEVDRALREERRNNA
jgi:hypothetical protein